MTEGRRDDTVGVAICEATKCDEDDKLHVGVISFLLVCSDSHAWDVPEISRHWETEPLSIRYGKLGREETVRADVTDKEKR